MNQQETSPKLSFISTNERKRLFCSLFESERSQVQPQGTRRCRNWQQNFIISFHVKIHINILSKTIIVDLRSNETPNIHIHSYTEVCVIRFTWPNFRLGHCVTEEVEDLSTHLPPLLNTDWQLSEAIEIDPCWKIPYLQQRLRWNCNFLQSPSPYRVPFDANRPFQHFFE